MFEEENINCNELIKRVTENIDALNINSKKEELEHLRMKQSDPDIFNNFEKLKGVNIAIKKIEDSIDPWFSLKEKCDDLSVLIEMAREESDAAYLEEIISSISSLEKDLDKLELIRMFKDESDYNNAYLSIQAGAGGTESCDWAMMLFRMYQRWIERKGFSYSVVEYQAGEEAGIKSVTISVQGAYAYGYLKCETGVHRLVRISPFDSNKRRHTSFCSVHTTAEIDDNIEVNLDPSELRIDTYRASGAGGQHVNTTDSAVRITHIPTGIVVSCQAERSQHQNKERSMKILRSKVYEQYKADKEAEIAEKSVEKLKIEWGSQIRSYVFHPYKMIKDLRTGYETANVQPVMDGDLDPYIHSYLKQSDN